MNRKVAAIAAVAVLLASPDARADEPRPLPQQHTVVPASGGTLGVLDRLYVVPPETHLLTKPAFDQLSLEIKTLRDDKTRRDAENAYLKQKMQSWQPGWRVLTISTVVGLAAGIYLGIKL